MTKQKEIKNEIRMQIKLLHENDFSAGKIAQELGISIKSVYRIISEIRLGKLLISPRSGRPRSTSVRDDRYLIKTLKKNRFSTARE